MLSHRPVDQRRAGEVIAAEHDSAQSLGDLRHQHAAPLAQSNGTAARQLGQGHPKRCGTLRARVFCQCPGCFQAVLRLCSVANRQHRGEKGRKWLVGFGGAGRKQQLASPLDPLDQGALSRLCQLLQRIAAGDDQLKGVIPLRTVGQRFVRRMVDDGGPRWQAPRMGEPLEVGVPQQENPEVFALQRLDLKLLLTQHRVAPHQPDRELVVRVRVISLIAVDRDLASGQLGQLNWHSPGRGLPRVIDLDLALARGSRVFELHEYRVPPPGDGVNIAHAEGADLEVRHLCREGGGEQQQQGQNEPHGVILMQRHA